MGLDQSRSSSVSVFLGRAILANSALDRLANAAHQVVIEGSSYRARLAPKRREPVS